MCDRIQGFSNEAVYINWLQIEFGLLEEILVIRFIIVLITKSSNIVKGELKGNFW